MLSSEYRRYNINLKPLLEPVLSTDVILTRWYYITHTLTDSCVKYRIFSQWEIFIGSPGPDSVLVEFQFIRSYFQLIHLIGGRNTFHENKAFRQVIVSVSDDVSDKVLKKVGLSI